MIRISVAATVSRKYFKGVFLLNFGQALEVLKDFGKVRLPFWSENKHIQIERSDEYTHPYFVVDSDKGSVPWIPTYPEMLSEDWEVVK